VVDGERLDDRLGLGPALIGRHLPHTEDMARFDLGEGALAPFAPALTAWLDQVGGQAVLVRPDRYMFGIGDPQTLLQAWRSHMTQKTAA
jgi:3-(3-hydroxy-phenyl)propionate hydroxylase